MLPQPFDVFVQLPAQTVHIDDLHLAGDDCPGGCVDRLVAVAGTGLLEWMDVGAGDVV